MIPEPPDAGDYVAVTCLVLIVTITITGIVWALFA